jgi:hypothetical protein
VQFFHLAYNFSILIYTIRSTLGVHKLPLSFAMGEWAASHWFATVSLFAIYSVLITISAMAPPFKWQPFLRMVNIPLNWKHMVVGMVKPNWIRQLCRKCGLYDAEIPNFCPFLSVHDSVSTLKGRANKLVQKSGIITPDYALTMPPRKAHEISYYCLWCV